MPHIIRLCLLFALVATVQGQIVLPPDSGTQADTSGYGAVDEKIDSLEGPPQSFHEQVVDFRVQVAADRANRTGRPIHNLGRFHRGWGTFEIGCAGVNGVATCITIGKYGWSPAFLYAIVPSVVLLIHGIHERSVGSALNKQELYE